VISASGTPTITSLMAVSGQSGSISDVDVNLNITHSYDGDLEITLIAPDGTRVLLINKQGGESDNFTNTKLDDAAATAIGSGSAPFTGSYQPDEALSALNGKSTTGTWTLEVKDTFNNDGGSLDNWSVTITTDGGGSGNEAPTFNVDPISKANATEDEAYSASIGSDASDPESDALTFSKVSGPAWLSVASDGSLSGAPGSDDVGANSFTVQVDATGGSDTATLNITVDPAGGSGGTQTFSSSDTPIVIDSSGTPTITSSLSVSGLTGSITDVNVEFNITHTYDEDLQVTLIAPDGTRVLLVSQVGGSDDNFTNTQLDDDASVHIENGSAPFSGTFIPGEALSGFSGKSAAGTWKMEVHDTYNNDGGSLDNWSVTITTDGGD